MISKPDAKREKEKRIIELMINLYCSGNHRKEQRGDKSRQGLCNECGDLLMYAKERIDKCPFAETKTFCSSCKVHCYKPHMREQIRRVMKYAGPRMMLYHPILAVKHVADTIKNKRRGKMLND